MTPCRLSIVVPVYHIEDYLGTCVESLLKQGFAEDEYEIVLVDDGGKDGCGKLCDEYAKTHACIRVIHQENQGLSGARNTGIKHSRGIYTLLVDGDDYIEPQVLPRLLDECERLQLDVMSVGYQKVSDGHVIGKHRKYHDGAPVMNGEEYMAKEMDFYCYVWRYIVRTEMLMQQAVFFRPHILYEDVDWTPRMLLAAKRIASSNTIVYNYRLREGSITHPKTREDEEKVISQHLQALQLLQEKIEQGRGRRWLESMSSCLVAATLTLVSEYRYTDKTAYIRQIKQVYTKSLHCQSSFDWRERLKVMLVKWSPEGYCWLRNKI